MQRVQNKQATMYYKVLHHNVTGDLWNTMRTVTTPYVRDVNRQDRQCTRSRIFVAVEKQKVLYICLRVRARTWVRVPVCVGVCMCVRTCTLFYPASNSYAPYCDVMCSPSASTIFFVIIS